jgi:hypothetical protein
MCGGGLRGRVYAIEFELCSLKSYEADDAEQSTKIGKVDITGGQGRDGRCCLRTEALSLYTGWAIRL